MTFSIVGRCERTGMFGVAITTSSICVASRCPWARAGVGAVATQNITDPRLGNALLDLLERGFNAKQAMRIATEGVENIDYRQLSVVDNTGASASFSGAHTLGINHVVEGIDCVGAGNLLDNTAVAGAMTENFACNTELHLADRLLTALEAGLGAGGEKGPVRSAGLLVVSDYPWPLVDLRCDWDDNGPIEKLRDLWNGYQSQMDDYMTRAVNPSAAPSYGVPGDC